MPRSDILEASRLVDQMRFAVHDGELSIKHIPFFMEQVIDTGAWRHRLVGMLPVKHERFIDFIATAPQQGMGWSTEEDIKRVESLLRYAPDVLVKWRKALTGEQGAHNDIVIMRPEQGNSLGYTLDRLLRQRPDLFEQVKAGELSANAAAIEAGFRRKPTRFDQIVRWLPQLTAEERARLRVMLEEEPA